MQTSSYNKVPDSYLSASFNFYLLDCTLRVFPINLYKYPVVSLFLHINLLLKSYAGYNFRFLAGWSDCLLFINCKPHHLIRCCFCDDVVSSSPGSFLFLVIFVCSAIRKCKAAVDESLHHWLLCVGQGGTMLGPPDTVVDLGETEVSEEIFMDYLSSLGESAYRFSNFFQQ